MKKITSPNLFNWATKELSQDAFICWISEWSNPYLKEKNFYMNSVGKEFITQLLNKHSIVYTDLHSVEVFKQKFNIDIVLKIDVDDNKYVLVVEDKMHALDYNPLDQYIKSISKDEYFENYIPLGLFIKTGDQASYLNVTSKSYALFLRNDFISFFEKIASIEGHNDILNDFRKRLIYSHNSVNSFASLKIKDWHWDSWKGFYNFIQKETKFKDWKYVSNPAGGFLCSNWPCNKMLNWDDDYKVYLQIEQGNLCFKLGEVYGDNQGKKEIRDKWHSIVMSEAKKNGLREIKRPFKMQPGTYMTVAIIERNDWLGEDESVLDADKVIQSLNNYGLFLENIVNQK